MTGKLLQFPFTPVTLTALALACGTLAWQSPQAPSTQPSTSPATKPALPRRLLQGTKVEIDQHGNDNWRPGTIRRVGKYHYFVNFDGWSEFFNAWVPDDRVKARDPRKTYPTPPPQRNIGPARPVPPEPPAPAPKPVEVARDPDPVPPPPASATPPSTLPTTTPSAPDVAQSESTREGVRIVDYRLAEVPFVPDAVQYPRPPVKILDMRAYENANPRQFKPDALLPGSEGREVIVVTHAGLGADNRQFKRLELLDIAQGRALGTADLLPGVVPVAASKDGRRITARIEDDRRKGHVMAVYQVAPGNARQLAAFAPFPGDRGDGSVIFCVPLEDSRVLAFGNRGEVGVYDITPGKRPEEAKVRAVWEAPSPGPVAPMALSPTLQYIAISREGGISVIRTTDGMCALRIDKAAGTLVFSPQGNRLAVAQGHMLSVYDLTTGKRTLRTLTSLDNSPIVSNNFWLTNDLLLMNGSLVVDVNLGLPVWRLKTPETPSGLMLGHYVTILPPIDPRAKAKFRSAPLPLHDFQTASESLKQANAFDFKPGDAVKLEISAPDDAVRARVDALLRKHLASIGVSVSPTASSTVRATIASGPSRTQKFRNFRTNEEREVSVPSRLVKFEWEVAGRIIYSESDTYQSYTGFVDTSKGETIESVVQKNLPTGEVFFDRAFPLNLTIPKPEFLKPTGETAVP